MPEMDGYQVCRAMRSDPTLAHIPILFLTAKVKAQDKIAGFNAGADDYLCKPFNVNELILRVQAILRRTRSQSMAETRQPALNQATPVELPPIGLAALPVDRRLRTGYSHLRAAHPQPWKSAPDPATI